MINKKKFIKMYEQIVDKEKINYSTVLIQSIMAYYVWITLSAIFVFQQFSTLQVFSVSIVFLFLFILLVCIFFTHSFGFSFLFSIQNIVLSFILFILMVIVTNFSDLGVASYFQIFPLLNTELGLGWHYDTAYHTSNIQSILNSGYPSIGQRDRLLLFYPALSHYIDAFILYLTHLEAYDSYGLFYHFHKFILYSSITIFIVFTFRNFKPYISLFAFALLVPIIADWHAVGSHSLWFTSVFLILSAPKIFHLLSKEESNTIKDFLLIFIIIFILSFGKISTGFTYAVFLGFYLLFKEPKNKLVYIFGFFLILFFLGYSNLMHSYSNSGEYGIDIGKLSYKFLFVFNPIRISLYTSLFLFAGVAFLFKNKRNLCFLFTSLVTYIVVVFITSISLAFSGSDVWYFYFGLNSVFVLFLVQNISLNMREYKIHFFALLNLDKKIIFLTTIISTYYLSTFYKKAPMDIKFNPQIQIDSKFFKVNKYLQKEDRFSYKNRLNNPFLSHQLIQIKRPLKLFRQRLYSFMDKHNIEKENTVMYLSKELFVKDVSQFKGVSWARGMLIYAITGVPLIYGIEKLRTNYGYADYDKKDLWKRSSRFKKKEACLMISSRYIIYVVNLQNPNFLLYDCENN